jgi:hypothetical protein
VAAFAAPLTAPVDRADRAVTGPSRRASLVDGAGRGADGLVHGVRRVRAGRAGRAGRALPVLPTAPVVRYGLVDAGSRV